MPRRRAPTPATRVGARRARRTPTADRGSAADDGRGPSIPVPVIVRASAGRVPRAPRSRGLREAVGIGHDASTLVDATLALRCPAAGKEGRGDHGDQTEPNARGTLHDSLVLSGADTTNVHSVILAALSMPMDTARAARSRPRAT